MTMENQFFVRQAKDYRNGAKKRDAVDAAIEAYCDAVYAEYVGISEAKEMIETERARLTQTRGWDKEELGIFDSTIEFCRGLPMEPMYAEFAKGAYAREIRLGEHA